MEKDTFKQDRFIVVRKNKTYSSGDKYPTIRIHKDIYALLAEVASESGLSMSELSGQAIRYALDRLEWVEE